ncbi:MAG: hypothetical protein M3483_07630 [Gemmatimonadota bacterium]|jgi:hypothetical protein|nr:hypothetical protein [Gemmatimonadota bacterium]
MGAFFSAAIVRFALDAMEKHGANRREAYGLAKQAYEEDKIEHAVPPLPTFYRWLRRASEADVAPTVRDFMERQREGRPRSAT